MVGDAAASAIRRVSRVLADGARDYNGWCYAAVVDSATIPTQRTIAGDEHISQDEDALLLVGHTAAIVACLVVADHTSFNRHAPFVAIKDATTIAANGPVVLDEGITNVDSAASIAHAPAISVGAALHRAVGDGEDASVEDGTANLVRRDTFLKKTVADDYTIQGQGATVGENAEVWGAGGAAAGNGRAVAADHHGASDDGQAIAAGKAVFWHS